MQDGGQRAPRALIGQQRSEADVPVTTRQEVVEVPSLRLGRQAQQQDGLRQSQRAREPQASKLGGDPIVAAAGADHDGRSRGRARGSPHGEAAHLGTRQAGVVVEEARGRHARAGQERCSLPPDEARAEQPEAACLGRWPEPTTRLNRTGDRIGGALLKHAAGGSRLEKPDQGGGIGYFHRLIPQAPRARRLGEPRAE